MEKWKTVEGYNNCYEVSNYGNVRKNGKQLSKSETRCGYYEVMFYMYGKQKHMSVHRLVAEAFIPNPLHKEVVNHIDGNKKNNNVKNLEWNTGSENGMHAVKNGLMEFNHISKKVIRKSDNKIYPSISECARQNGLAKSTVFKMCNRNYKSLFSYV